MTQTLERRSYRLAEPRPSGSGRKLPFPDGRGPDPARRRWRGIVWGLLLGLAFCHGCHGDEDNELCALLPPQPKRVSPAPIPCEERARSGSDLLIVGGRVESK